MTFQPRSAVVWFAVGGGPIAFAAQFVAGLAFSFAQCNQSASRWQLPLHSWQAALAAAGLVAGLASMATAIWLFLRTFRIGDVFEEERSGGEHATAVSRRDVVADTIPRPELREIRSGAHLAKVAVHDALPVPAPT